MGQDNANANGGNAMYTNILVPIDLSHEEVGDRILAIAAKIRGAGGKITALHVSPDIPSYVETYVPAEIRETRISDQRKALETMAQNSGVADLTIRVAQGTPHVRILDAIDELEPDLIIIGSHKPGLSDYFLGSTAARVVRHANCSVLVDR